jgi:hypothetical protein
MIGVRHLGEFDGNSQHTCFVDQIQLIIPVISSVATDTVMHKQNRCLGAEITRPRGVQYQRTIRECGVVVGERGSASLNEAYQIGRLHQCFLASASGSGHQDYENGLWGNSLFITVSDQLNGLCLLEAPAGLAAANTRAARIFFRVWSKRVRLISPAPSRSRRCELVC